MFPSIFLTNRTTSDKARSWYNKFTFSVTGITHTILRMMQLSLCVVYFALLSSVHCTFFNKHINVSEFGIDNTTCLSGDVDCRTLWYALQGLDNSTLISITYSHEFDRTPAMFLSSLDNVAIVGEMNPTIACVDGAGISFVSSANIVIRGIEWIGCSVSHPTTGYYPQLNISFPNATSAFFFHLCLNVTISNCTFSSNRGSGVSLYDTGGEVLIVYSDFTDHYNNCSSLFTHNCSQISRGLSIEFTYCGRFELCPKQSDPYLYNSGTMYSIVMCTFRSNVNTYDGSYPSVTIHGANYWPFGKGGGLALVVRGTARMNNFEIYNPIFLNNRAEFGGSMLVEILDQASENVITIRGDVGSNSGSIGGHAELGGAIYIAMFTDGDELNMGGNILNVSDFVFDNNSAYECGGAVIFFTNGQHGVVHTVPITFVNCYWGHNRAPSGGAISTSLEYNQVIHALKPITFLSNTWSQNRESCTITTHQIPLSFSGITTVENSSSTGLCIESAEVLLGGVVTFERNRGTNGGAIALIGSAWLTVSQGLNLTFANNYADTAGGAIFFGNENEDVLRKYGIDNRCLFKYVDPLAPIQEWNATITFRDNNLVEGGEYGIGKSIFLINTFGCHTSNGEVTLLVETVFSYYPNVTEQLATPAITFIPHQPIYNNSDTYVMNLTLGQYILFNISARDAFNNIVKTTANVYMQCNTSTGPYYGYHLVGLRAVVISDIPFVADLQVTGPEIQPEGVSCYLVLVAAGASDPELNIQLNFIAPGLGFYYDPSLEAYTCFSSPYITCNTTNLTVCLHYGYWYGEVKNGNASVFTVTQCPSEVCTYVNGNCPTKPCDELNTFCEMPQAQDDQCSMNRGGLLCTECEPNYSFTYDALQCVDDDTCSAGSFVLFFFLNIVFVVVVIAGLLLIVRLNLRVGSGYMYSFLYYFSVVLFLLPKTLPSSFLTILVINIVSFTQLDSRFLGLIDLCVLAQLDRLAHTALHYIQPILISLAIVMITCLARRFPRFLRFTRTSPVHAICLLTLLSFTSITETSFLLLAPIQLKNALSTRVQIQPRVTYFDPRHHLPYAVVALLVEVVIVFPLTFLLLTAPLLARFVNLTRIKPFLDEYQACYRDQYRWVAGFYFLARQAVFLVSTFHVGSSTKPYILMILQVVIAVFHTGLRPYRHWWLNVIDTVLLTDLAFISILYNGETANTVFQFSQDVREAFVHILILIPGVYFVALCLTLLIIRVRNHCKDCRKRSYFQLSNLEFSNNIQSGEAEEDEEGDATPTPTVSYLPKIHYDQESLLALIEDNADNPPKTYETIKQEGASTTDS